MKIFALLNNYDSKETDSLLPQGGEPLWYEMPDSSILRSGNPFFVPDFDTKFTAHVSLVYRIGRLGKSISPRFASRYIDAWGMAVAVIANDTLIRLKKEGMPWTRAVSFDRSCILGNLQPIDTFIDNKEIEINISSQTFSYFFDRLNHPVEEIIAMLSNENTLKNGDLILAGLVAKGTELIPGHKLKVTDTSLNTNLLDTNIK